MSVMRQRCSAQFRKKQTLTVQTPVHLSYSPGRVEETLEDVAEDDSRAETDTHRLDRIHHTADHVRGCLEDVGPDEVEQVRERLFVPQASDAERQMLDNCGRVCRCTWSRSVKASSSKPITE